MRHMGKEESYHTQHTKLYASEHCHLSFSLSLTMLACYPKRKKEKQGQPPPPHALLRERILFSDLHVKNFSFSVLPTVNVSLSLSRTMSV